MGYNTVAEVKAKETIAGKSDADYQAAIDWASVLIDKITGDQFVKSSLTIRVSGSGTRRQPLYPITLLRCLSVSSVRDIPTDTVVEVEYYIEDSRYLTMIEPITIRAGASTQVWPKGIRSLEVIGEFGWEETPKPIQEATMLLALRKLKVPTGSSITGEVTGERIGDYSYTKKSGMTEKQGPTGIAEVDAILKLYQNKFIALMAV